jgi:hypothetical protein
VIPASWLYRILAGALAAAALLWLVHSRDRWRDEARSNAELFHDEKAAHAATVANYRAAAEQSRREDAANLARVEAEQAAINERTKDDFQSRIASARADARRLRSRASAAETDSGTGGAAPVPAVPAPSEGASQAAGEDGLSSSDRLLATEQAIQLDELITWIRNQAGVDNGNDPSSCRGNCNSAAKTECAP